jgi:nucleoside-diphosphate-sugar epimerase
MGIRQFLYTGTIDSYDSESARDPITDATPIDPRISTRNLYARSKAQGEAILGRLSLDKGLPLTIARPGIVIGENGPPCHWGVAMWYSPTTCRLWGDGNHPLPFVLVEDVADALVAMLNNSVAIGSNFLLVGPPLLSARQYVEAYASALGARLDVHSRRSSKWFIEDFAKYTLKKLVRRSAHLPTLHDWRCRSHRRPYQPRKAREMLKWECCNDVQELIRCGIEIPVEQFMR